MFAFATICKITDFESMLFIKPKNILPTQKLIHYLNYQNGFKLQQKYFQAIKHLNISHLFSFLYKI